MGVLILPPPPVNALPRVLEIIHRVRAFRSGRDITQSFFGHWWDRVTTELNPVELEQLLGWLDLARARTRAVRSLEGQGDPVARELYRRWLSRIKVISDPDRFVPTSACDNQEAT